MMSDDTAVRLYDTNGRCQQSVDDTETLSSSRVRNWFAGGLVAGVWDDGVAASVQTTSGQHSRTDHHYAWSEQGTIEEVAEQLPAAVASVSEFSLATDSSDAKGRFHEVAGSVAPEPAVPLEAWTTIERMELTEPIRIGTSDLQTAVAVMKYAVVERDLSSVVVRQRNARAEIDAEIDIVLDSAVPETRLTEETIDRIDAAYERVEREQVQKAVSQVEVVVEMLRSETRLSDSEIATKLNQPLPANRNSTVANSGKQPRSSSVRQTEQSEFDMRPLIKYVIAVLVGLLLGSSAVAMGLLATGNDIPVISAIVAMNSHSALSDCLSK